MASQQQVESNEVTLLLVGNAGNGKSATGNSILREQVFENTASTSAGKSDIRVASSSFNELTLNVVDVPGVDTDKSDEEFLKLSTENIKQALKMCDYRFSALVIVLKCGARFTKKESDFIKTIKGILGKNVITDFGVCVITHGDNFQADYEDENLSFEDWCKQQGGEIKILFEECNYRCALFNNRTKDPSLRDSQISKLLKIVPNKLQYNKSDFDSADAYLQKLIMQTKAPNILKEAHVFINTKREDIKLLQPNIDIEKDIRFYEALKQDIEIKELTLRREYAMVDSIDQYLVDIKLFTLEINNTIRSLISKKANEQAKPNIAQSQTPIEQEKQRASRPKNIAVHENPDYLPPKNQTEQAKSNIARSKTPTEQDKQSASRSKNIAENHNYSPPKRQKDQAKTNSWRPKVPTQKVGPDSSRRESPTEKTKLNSSRSENKLNCCHTS